MGQTVPKKKGNSFVLLSSFVGDDLPPGQAGIIFEVRQRVVSSSFSASL